MTNFGSRGGRGDINKQINSAKTGEVLCYRKHKLLSASLVSRATVLMSGHGLSGIIGLKQGSPVKPLSKKGTVIKDSSVAVPRGEGGKGE